MKWKVQLDRDVYEWFAWYPVTVKIDGEEYWVWWERVKVLERYNWTGVSYTYYVCATHPLGYMEKRVGGTTKMTHEERAVSLLCKWAEECALYTRFDAPPYLRQLVRVFQAIERDTWEEAAKEVEKERDRLTQATVMLQERIHALESAAQHIWDKGMITVSDKADDEACATLAQVLGMHYTRRK